MYLLLDIYNLVAGIGRLLIQALNIEEITVQLSDNCHLYIMQYLLFFYQQILISNLPFCIH